MRPTEHLFDSSSHLSEEGVALYADAVRLGRIAEVPDSLREHVEACSICKVEIVELVSLQDGEPAAAGQKHPIFDAKHVAPKVSIMTLYRIAMVLAAVFFLALLYILIWGVPAGPRSAPPHPHSIPEIRQAPDTIGASHDSAFSALDCLSAAQHRMDPGPVASWTDGPARPRGDPVQVPVIMYSPGRRLLCGGGEDVCGNIPES